MEKLENHGILKNDFPGLESRWFFGFVMENISLGHGRWIKVYQSKDDLDFFQKKFNIW